MCISRVLCLQAQLLTYMVHWVALKMGCGTKGNGRRGIMRGDYARTHRWAHVCACKNLSPNQCLCGKDEIRLTSMHTFYCTRLWVEVEASQEAGEQGVQELAANRNGGGNIHSRMRKMLGPGVCFCI